MLRLYLSKILLDGDVFLVIAKQIHDVGQWVVHDGWLCMPADCS